jgi:hypothetical protein
MKLKILSYDDIFPFLPEVDDDYDFGFDESWTGTVLDILRNTQLSVQDRFNIACQEEFVEDNILSNFLYWLIERGKHWKELKNSNRELSNFTNSEIASLHNEVILLIVENSKEEDFDSAWDEEEKIHLLRFIKTLEANND